LGGRKKEKAQPSDLGNRCARYAIRTVEKEKKKRGRGRMKFVEKKEGGNWDLNVTAFKEKKGGGEKEARMTHNC